MQERHRNRKKYFEEQGVSTKKFVIPYIERSKKIQKGTRVLEVGCGEGGNLTPFLDLECEVVGIELIDYQLKKAKEFIYEKFENPNVQLLNLNIYDASVDDIGRFDVIFLRDVIEHIHDQNKFMKHLKQFLKPDAVVFFGFPPWRMPFGGHQQVCESKVLSKLPYFHLLPKMMYKGILRMFGEPDWAVKTLMETRSTGIGINKFQRFVHANDYEFVEKDLYLINPNYETKFGLKPRLQFGLIKNIPYLRDFLTTCMYCLIKVK